MSKYTEKQKAEILARARACLAQHEASKKQQVQPVKNNAAERWERRQPEAAAARYRETPDPDWDVLGNGQAREFYHQVMAAVIYELQREFDHKLKGQAEQIRSVELQLAEMRGANGVCAAEYRNAIRELCHQGNTERSKEVIDLPNVLQRRGLN